MTVQSSTAITTTCASVAPMSFWMTRREPERVAVASSPWWSNFNVRVRSTPRMNASTHGPILAPQPEHVRAGEPFLRATRGEPVQSLVQIHDEAMHAVAPVFGNSGQLGDSRRSDLICGLEQPFCLDRCQPAGCRPGPRTERRLRPRGLWRSGLSASPRAQVGETG